MHYLKQLIFFLFISTSSFAQGVGIGTSNPNASAILDVNSTNKGLLLPRVTDTNKISTPAEGLMVYNRASKAPNYFDGSKWNNVADARNNYVPLEGFIKYSLGGITTVGGMAVETGQLDAIDYYNQVRLPRNQAGVNSARGLDSIVFEKEADGNSIIFTRAMLSGQLIPTIEILQFKPGATTAFYSIKLSTARILEQYVFISEKTGRLTERYSILALTIGFRDVVTGKSFSITPSTGAFGAY
ncbi:MAG: hypothetical protein EOP53_14680 [Sphingobacteriales bacterium]|nr:MAG: hypothetical protein EOP53_14680 [Sphingobacteriales bacterium]